MQSARVGGPLEGVASSSSREQTRGLGSVSWPLSPLPCAPSNPHFSARVSLRVSVQLSPCMSVSRARLPSPAPHPPFSWRQVRRSRFSETRLRAASTAPSARPVLTPPEPRFLPQTAQARPPMGGRVSSPGSFRGLPCASKANADWMSALSSRLWDVPLHQLSIPGEAPRARLGGQAAARWSRVCEASVPNMTTCRHTHVHAHTCTRVHTAHQTRARMHTYTPNTHAHTDACTHTYTHQHLPVCVHFILIQPRRNVKPGEPAF